jgi:hypothetical protein
VGTTVAEENGRIQAIPLMMSLNLQHHLECPIESMIGETLGRWIRRLFLGNR